LDDNNEPEVIFSTFDTFDEITNVIFILEFVIKTIALGFVFGEGSYLQNNWNKLDFLIVIVSLFSFPGITFSNHIEGLRVFKFLRILKALRIISRNYEMKLITTSLIDSLYPISSVMLLTFMFMLIFSIICINIISNLYDTCYQEFRGYEDSQQIYWNPVKNFSDFFPLYNITENNTADIINLVSKLYRHTYINIFIHIYLY